MARSSGTERELADDFLYHIGSALTNWQRVESVCFEIYGAAMKGAATSLISVTWHHILSFDSRLDMLNNCLYFAKMKLDQKADWEPLRKRTEKASRVRNLIVHSPYSVHHTRDTMLVTLQPSFLDATAMIRKRVGNPDYTLDSDRLEDEARKFRKLSDDLRAFRKAAFAHG